MKTLLVRIPATLIVIGMLAAPVFVAGNPSGTGQPDQSCQAEPTGPNGFNTSGFNHAALVYAGSPDSPTVSNGANSHAVSQYDVACYQVSNH